MIHQDVISGHIQFEIDDGSAASRDGNGLYPPGGRALYVAQTVNAIENFPDHVKGRSEVWTADAKEDAHRFAHSCFHRMELGERTHRAIEDEVLGALVQQFFDAEFLAAALPECGFCIDLALHDIELVVDRRQSA